MDIILDTSILRQDFLLKSRKTEMFIDYLSKTDNRVVLPEIVVFEILACYERTLVEKLESLKNAINGVNKLSLTQVDIDSPDFDSEEHRKMFKQNLEDCLGVTKRSIWPTNNDYLPELVNRAINRIPPSTKDNKTEFRDVLIWLTILDIAEGSSEKKVAFICANTRDFADRNGNLLDKLRKEAEDRKVSVKYYASLNDFIKSVASKIEFITYEWLEGEVDLEKLEEEVLNNFEYDQLEKLIQDKLDSNSVFREVTHLRFCSDLRFLNFFVYEMEDGSIRVEASVEGELEVEFLKYCFTEERLEMEAEYNCLDGEFEFNPVLKEQVLDKKEYGHIYPVVVIEVHLIIKDKKIVSAEAIDCSRPSA